MMWWHAFLRRQRQAQLSQVQGWHVLHNAPGQSELWADLPGETCKHWFWSSNHQSTGAFCITLATSSVWSLPTVMRLDTYCLLRADFDHHHVRSTKNKERELTPRHAQTNTRVTLNRECNNHMHDRLTKKRFSHRFQRSYLLSRVYLCECMSLSQSWETGVTGACELPGGPVQCGL